MHTPLAERTETRLEPPNFGIQSALFAGGSKWRISGTNDSAWLGVPSRFGMESMGTSESGQSATVAGLCERAPNYSHQDIVGSPACQAKGIYDYGAMGFATCKRGLCGVSRRGFSSCNRSGGIYTGSGELLAGPWAVVGWFCGSFEFISRIAAQQVVLVEAKSHVPEIYGSGCQASATSLVLIEKSLACCCKAMVWWKRGCRLDRSTLPVCKSIGTSIFHPRAAETLCLADQPLFHRRSVQTYQPRRVAQRTSESKECAGTDYRSARCY